MNTSYFELRQKTSLLQNAELAADIARHLQARQHLGKAVVICEKPLSLLSVVRKHWLKQARTLQTQRSSTINAERILRLTNSITHMHRMSFIAQPPEIHPQSHVFFVEPNSLDILPVNTYSVYITQPLERTALAALQRQLPAEALFIDYTRTIQPPYNHLQPKDLLEQHIHDEWLKVVQFLETHFIEVETLTQRSREAGIIDDALDTLLGISHQFLQVAGSFQHTLELAQPVHLDNREQHQYDVITLLAYRVQALSPQLKNHHFTHNLNEDETFFLHDMSTEDMTFAEVLTVAIKRHRREGRERLAQALTFMPH